MRDYDAVCRDLARLESDYERVHLKPVTKVFVDAVTYMTIMRHGFTSHVWKGNWMGFNLYKALPSDPSKTEEYMIAVSE